MLRASYVRQFQDCIAEVERHTDLQWAKATPSGSLAQSKERMVMICAQNTTGLRHERRASNQAVPELVGRNMTVATVGVAIRPSAGMKKRTRTLRIHGESNIRASTTPDNIQRLGRKGSAWSKQERLSCAQHPAWMRTELQQRVMPFSKRCVLRTHTRRMRKCLKAWCARV